MRNPIFIWIRLIILLVVVFIFISFERDNNLTSSQSSKGNTALMPVPKLEEDSYDWWRRHHEILRIKDSINPEIVLIGNSITHYWGGVPAWVDNKGNTRAPRAEEAWDLAFGSKRVLNLGFGWDRTQNVLWRLENGEMEGLSPKYTVIHIGTNNTSETKNARMNTAKEIAEGVEEICKKVKKIAPNTKIVLMAIMPREQNPDHPRRVLIDETNRILKKYAERSGLKFVDIGPVMLDENRVLTREIAGDFCHPTRKGYRIWAKELKSILQ